MLLPFRSRSILQLLELQFLQHSGTHHFSQQQQRVWQHALFLKPSASSHSLCVWTTQQHCDQLCFWQSCRIYSISVIWLLSRKQTSNYIFQHWLNSYSVSLSIRREQYQCSKFRIYFWSHNYIKFNRYVLNSCSSHFLIFVIMQWTKEILFHEYFTLENMQAKCMEIEKNTEDLYSAVLIWDHFSSVWEIQFRNELEVELFCAEDKSLLDFSLYRSFSP